MPYDVHDHAESKPEIEQTLTQVLHSDTVYKLDAIERMPSPKYGVVDPK